MSHNTASPKKEPSLTWTERVKFFEEMKNPLLREQAAINFVHLHDTQIRYIVRQSNWGKQWGYEDAYQHAVLFVLEQAEKAEEPDGLPKRFDILNAVKEEAAKQLYAISLSAYKIRKYGCNEASFDRESIVADASNRPQVFDELTWRRIQKLAEGQLNAKDMNLFRLLMEIPGRIPSIEEIAERLSLKLETAQRYLRTVKRKLRELPELLAMYQETLGKHLEPVLETSLSEPPVPEKPVVAVASVKVVSVVQWRRTKIGRVLGSMTELHMCLRSVLRNVMAVEDILSLRSAGPPHPTVSLRYQQREHLILRVLNKPLHLSELTEAELVEVLSERLSRGRPWNDWNPDKGDQMAS